MPSLHTPSGTSLSTRVESSERCLSFQGPLNPVCFLGTALPPPRSHPTHLAGGEGNECFISEKQAAILVHCDSRGHSQCTERDICPVLTPSSSAPGWGNQRQPAGDESWGSRHSQPGSTSEPRELQGFPPLTPVPAQDPSPGREQTQAADMLSSQVPERGWDSLG